MATGSTGVAVGKECNHVMSCTRFSNENPSPSCGKSRTTCTCIQCIISIWDFSLQLQCQKGAAQLKWGHIEVLVLAAFSETAPALWNSSCLILMYFYHLLAAQNYLTNLGSCINVEGMAELGSRVKRGSAWNHYVAIWTISNPSWVPLALYLTLTKCWLLVEKILVHRSI